MNVLEMNAIQLSLKVFIPSIMGESALLMSDNAGVVVYLKKKETFFGTCSLAQQIVE